MPSRPNCSATRARSTGSSSTTSARSGFRTAYFASRGRGPGTCSGPADPPPRGCLLALAPAHGLRLVILVALFVLALLRRAGRRLQLARPFAELSRQTSQPAALAVISLHLFSHRLSS